MNSELDDLFRQELNGHASEPGADLWARLQARTAAEAAAPADADPVDARFRTGLAGHATPPRRELWERLEDEHLRPRQRRRVVVAWGRLAVAASLLLLVLAGGAGLWWNARSAGRGTLATGSGRTNGQLATSPRASANTAGSAADQPASTTGAGTTTAGTTQEIAAATQPNTHRADNQATSAPSRPAEAGLLTAENAGRKKNQKNYSAQATGLGASPSSSPVASTAAQRRSATASHPVPGLPTTTPQPDATAGSALALGGQKPTESQHTTQPETPVLAAASPPMQVIEVEVRRGGRPVASSEPVVAVAAAPAEAPDAPQRPHFRLSGLLRQAGHALHGEQVNLAEATGLPETVTVQARLGERVLSRTIRL